MEYRWKIALVVTLTALLGIVWVLVSAPIYKADGLIQVEEKTSGISALKELQPLVGDDTTVVAELEILSSRMVLGRVVENLQLNIEVAPNYFPIIGLPVFRRYKGLQPNEAWLGLAKYAWGGEALKVDTLSVPDIMLDRPLELVAREKDGFDLRNEDGEIVLSGKVGKLVVDNNYSILVSTMDARLGTAFIVTRLSQEAAIAKLRQSFNVKERGKKSGILEVSVVGSNPDRNVVVLDEILKSYVRQNIERRSAEAENTLRFLETQLPSMKRDLDAAERAYNTYRQSRGSLDLSIETQSVLQSIVEIDNQIVTLKQERDELRQSFTAEHPRVQAVDQRLGRLQERRKQFDSDISRLPDTQQKVLQLARDVEVSTTLYTNLVNTAQQLKVSKSGTVGDVRIIDAAAKSRDLVGKPAPIVLVISVFIGFVISAILIWIERSIRVVVEDPEIIEEKLGLPVYAVVPHSDEEISMGKRKKSAPGICLLSQTSPDDDAIESLRSLRTTIHFALLDGSRNSILITGASPRVGKSFISKNLAAVIAQTGKRIVLIDADLRKGYINKAFSLPREIGVSEFVSGIASLSEIVKPTSVPNFWLVTTGQLPPNPSEMLMHQRFRSLIESLEEQFDMVIVDAPPILAVTDASIIGRQVGATLLIVRAGHHPLRELEQAVKRLSSAGVRVNGFVFNDLNTERQRYRYGYKGYVYRYTYGAKS